MSTSAFIRSGVRSSGDDAAEERSLSAGVVGAAIQRWISHPGSRRRCGVASRREDVCVILSRLSCRSPRSPLVQTRPRSRSYPRCSSRIGAIVADERACPTGIIGIPASLRLSRSLPSCIAASVWKDFSGGRRGARCTLRRRMIASFFARWRSRCSRKRLTGRARIEFRWWTSVK